jgi:hypothetical protein
VTQMKAKPDQGGAVFEAGEGQFVRSDDAKTCKRNGQCVAMK